MTSVPLAVILIPLFLFLILFFVFSIFNLYHIIHYGLDSGGKFVILAFYVAGTLFFLGGSYLVLHRYNWQTPLASQGVIDAARKTNLFDLPTVPLREFDPSQL